MELETVICIFILTVIFKCIPDVIGVNAREFRQFPT